MDFKFLSDLLIKLFHKFKLNNEKAFIVVVVVAYAIKAALESDAFKAAFGGTLPGGVQAAADWVLLICVTLLGVHTTEKVAEIETRKRRK
jgi:hypothetical protein